MITYCKRCVMPNTVPSTVLDDDGVCGGCRSFDARKDINWEQREANLKSILSEYRSRDGVNYDCVVPVSGGKDSTFQVLKVLEYGMNPLCVTASTDMLTEIGRRNIENLKSLGVDYVEVSTNPKVRRIINRNALTTRGDNILAEHATIFTVPVRLAVAMNIPLIVWGENSQNEVGGDPKLAGGTMSREYLKDAIHGFNPEEYLALDGIEKKDLIQYTYPSDEELDRVGVTGIFLGYYLSWDGLTNAILAQAHGLTTAPEAIEGSCVSYENLDNAYTGIHDYLMFVKCGFGRASAIASFLIRRGILSRETALEIVKEREGKFPWTYLGVPIETVLNDLRLDLGTFMDLCDSYTNRDLFKTDEEELVRDQNDNLIKLNYDNVEA